MALRVVIADDHALMREGLRFILHATGTMHVVAEASTGNEAVSAVERHRPDVVLMDITMPDLNGIEATRMIATRRCATRVIILSMHTNAEHVYQALRAGAMGYVVKEAAGREVVEAIRQVTSGGTYVSPAIDTLPRLAPVRSGGTLTGPSPLERLTPRERQVLQLACDGKTNAETAAALGLSPKSVETYRSRLMGKLGVSSTAELVKLAVLHGLTPLP